MGLRGAAGTLWPGRRTEYVDHDSEPPPEWREAPRPSGASAEHDDDEGIEVVEQTAGVARIVETHYRVRCECGKRWWAIDLQPASCPRCRRWVSIQD